MSESREFDWNRIIMFIVGISFLLGAAIQYFSR